MKDFLFAHSASQLTMNTSQTASIFFLLFLPTVIYATSPECPNPCHCDSDKRHINCSWSDLRTVPDLQHIRGHYVSVLDLSHNTQLHLEFGSFRDITIDVLKLSFCGLRSITEGVFDDANISTLHLDHNDLKFDDTKKSFRGLDSSLINLILHDNNQQTIPQSQLAILKSLHELDISRNLIGNIVIRDLKTLDLKRIYLAYNQIYSVDNHVFDRFTHVEYLDLSHNYIFVIDFLSAICKFGEVNLEGNPIHCSCNFITNRKFDVKGKFSGTCSSPPALAGLSLSNQYFLDTGSRICSIGGVPNIECQSAIDVFEFDELTHSKPKFASKAYRIKGEKESYIV